MTAVCGKMGTGTSLEEFRGVCASCDAQGCQKEYMGSKRSQDICHGEPTVVKKFMGSPSFFHGLRCTSRFSIFRRTTPRNHHGWLTENKSALGRRVPKCWALLDFSAGISSEAFNVRYDTENMNRPRVSLTACVKSRRGSRISLSSVILCHVI